MRIQPILNITKLGYNTGCHKRIYIKSFFSFPRSWKDFCQLLCTSASMNGTMADVEAKITPVTTSEDVCVTGTKRPVDDCSAPSGDVDNAKKLRREETKLTEENGTAFVKRKKVAMLIMYAGKGYQGMQRNPGTRTIESDLLEAFVKGGIVTRDQIEKPGESIQFQRAARTDKGVSAAGQIVSLKIKVDNPVEKINQHLCDQIRVIDMKRVTKKYDCKNAASARTYSYILPTFTFCPFEQIAKEDFRITEPILTRLNLILAQYRGTHNFHNFTSGKKPTDPSAKRYILQFTAGTPFIQNDLEFVMLSIKGQSFMLHQIRKMIGLAIAISRGLTGIEAIQKAFHKEKFDVPKAPGLGLILNQVHFDYYNKKFGGDGTHEALLWDENKERMEAFKEKYIYSTIVDTEKEEKSMLRWMSTLHLHKYDTIKPLPAAASADEATPPLTSSTLTAAASSSPTTSTPTPTPTSTTAAAPTPNGTATTAAAPAPSSTPTPTSTPTAATPASAVTSTTSISLETTSVSSTTPTASAGSGNEVADADVAS